MSNILNSNPVIVGAGGMASSYKSSVAATLGTLFTVVVAKLYWENATGPGYVRIIDPGSGNELASLYIPSAGDVTADWSAKPRLWQDFRVSQVDSGTLKIYLV